MSIAPVAMHAQAEHGFKAIAVEQDFTPNGFNWFRHAFCWRQDMKSTAMP